MWDPIDAKMDLLMDPAVEPKGPLTEYLRGAADMMAVFLNPSRPDVREVKRLALQRWRYRHYESENWF